MAGDRKNERERATEVRTKIEERIDMELGRQATITAVTLDPEVLGIYSRYLAFAAAENYRKSALTLSVALVLVSVVGLVVSFVPH